ncbi:MAG: BrnA antitoxin family protein [Ardenticatenaceae bacterium]
MNMEDEIITLDVTVKEYQQDLASGLREDEVLQPGRHRFKRGGFLARHGLQGERAATAAGKVRILIDLDHDILDYFKQRARQPNAVPYQTQINKALRELIEREKMPQQIAA